MIFHSNHQEILRKAIDTWGVKDQMDMAVGECGEFLTLVGRKAQNRDTVEDWISEISDVIIMMEQMATIFGYDKVYQQIQLKMTRLEDRINNYK